MTKGRVEPLAVHIENKMLASDGGTRSEYVRQMRDTLRSTTAEYEQMLADPASSPHNLERMEVLLKWLQIRVDDQGQE